MIYFFYFIPLSLAAKLKYETGLQLRFPDLQTDASEIWVADYECLISSLLNES